MQTDRCDLAGLCIIVYPLCFRKDSGLELQTHLGSQILRWREIFSLGTFSFLLYSLEEELETGNPHIAGGPGRR